MSTGTKSSRLAIFGANVRPIYPSVAERGLWVAVSACVPDNAMHDRLRDLAARSGHWVHLLVGEPQPGFEVWSWRQSEHINIDGKHGVADIATDWLNYDWSKGSAFDVDFAAHTVGRHSDIANAFRNGVGTLEQRRQED